MRATLRLALALAALAAACSEPTPSFDAGDDAPGADRPSGDARSDARPLDGAAPDGECTSDSQCDDTTYCNGAERCVAGRCTTGTPPCDDRYACTADTCDEAGRSCTRAPDHAICDDGNACNGAERCDPTTPGALSGSGCQPVYPDHQIDCDDRNTCTIDGCDNRLGCVHSPRDLDGDGHVDRACTLDGTPTGTQGDDCNDSDPRTFPGAPEVCTDNRDNNCNLLVDLSEPAACRPANGSCATAERLAVMGPGTYTRTGSTSGLAGAVATSCGGASPRAAAVYVFTLATAQSVSASFDDESSSAAVTLASACEPLAEVRCARGTSGFPAAAPEVQVRSLPAGTYYVLVQTSSPRVFRLRLRIGEATTPPEFDVCPAAGSRPSIDLADGVARTVSFGGLLPDYSLSCDMGAPAPDAVYPLTLSGTRNVTVTTTGLSGGGRVTIALSRSPCGVATSELPRGCASGFAFSPPRVVARELAAGTYYVIVRSADGGPVTVQATLTDPTMRVRGDVCPGIDVTPDGPAATVNTLPFDRFADYGTPCGSASSPDNWTDWVFHFRLTEPRDVIVTMTGSGATALRMQLQRACGAGGAAVGACQSGPAVVARYRGLTAGDYYIVGEASGTPPGVVTATVSTMAPGVRTPGDVCPGVAVTPDGAPVVLAAGAFDNASDHGTTCGSGRPSAGWTDFVFSYALASERDVIITLTPGAGAALAAMVESRCGDAASIVGSCRTASGAVLTLRLPRQAPGTYFLVGEARGTLPTVTAAITTSAPGSAPGYTRSVTPATVPWIDACGAAGSRRIGLAPGTDDGTDSMVPLGFPFRFYGVPFSGNIAVTSNGWIAFLPTTSAVYSNTPLPNTDEPNAAIYALWDDLYIRASGGAICYATTGAAPNRTYTVEWSDMHFCCSDDATHLTFEVQLHETTNVVDVLYNRMVGEDPARGAGGSATVGIENVDGSDGDQYCAEAGCAITPSTRIRWTPTGTP